MGCITFYSTGLGQPSRLVTVFASRVTRNHPSSPSPVSADAVSESISRSKNEKLEFHLTMLYGLLRDLMILRESGGDIR